MAGSTATVAGLLRVDVHADVDPTLGGARPDRIDRGADGEQITIEASGLEARVIQHEIDHLDGVLILDRTSRDQRREAMRALREAQSPAAA